ncbi:MAG: hypothetical protein ACRCVT_00915, partial [Leadbetterella sp.]
MVDFNIQRLGICSGHKGSVFSLSKSHLEDYFISSGEDGTVVQWSLHNLDIGKPIAQMKGSVYAMHLIHHTSILVVAQNQSGLHFIDLQENKEIATIAIPNATFFDIKQRDTILYVADNQGRIWVINGVDKTLDVSMKVSQKSIRSISLDTERDILFCGTSDNELVALDMYKLEKIDSQIQHSGSVFSVYNEGDTIYTGARDAKINLWNFEEQFQLKTQVPAHMYAVNDLCPIPNRNLIVSCSMDRTI